MSKKNYTKIVHIFLFEKTCYLKESEVDHKFALLSIKLSFLENFLFFSIV